MTIRVSGSTFAGLLLLGIAVGPTDLRAQASQKAGRSIHVSPVVGLGFTSEFGAYYGLHAEADLSAAVRIGAGIERWSGGLVCADGGRACESAATFTLLDAAYRPGWTGWIQPYVGGGLGLLLDGGTRMAGFGRAGTDFMIGPHVGFRLDGRMQFVRRNRRDGFVLSAGLRFTAP